MNFRSIIVGFLLIVYSSSFIVANAQQHKPDSLHVALRKAKADTDRIITMNLLSESLWRTGNYDSAAVWANKAQKLAEKTNYKSGMAAANRNMGVVFQYRNNYSRALECFQNALEISGQAGNKAEMSRDMGNIAMIYSSQGEISKSLEYYYKALTIDQERGSNPGIASDYIGIGTLYSQQGNTDKALEYFEKSLAINRLEGDKTGIAINLVNIGVMYSSMGKDTLALKSYQEALNFYNAAGDKRDVEICLGNMAIIYTDRASAAYNNHNAAGADSLYKKALEYNQRAMKISREIFDRAGTAAIYGSLGNLYENQKKYKEAKLSFDSTIIIAKNIGQKETLEEGYNARSFVESVMGDYKASLDDYRISVLYHDSIVNEANTKKTTQAEMTFQFKQQEAEQKAEQGKKDAIAAAENKKQKVITWSVVAGLLLVMAFAGFVVRSLRLTQRQKQIIEVKNKEVEEKNKDILDSITYAKRLQDAILPPLSVFKTLLPESFLLYKPKDIVAGDFYWMEKVNDTVLVAACDCTGHGVPGAMVSVVCSNALNRALNEFKIRETGKILDKVRELVLETFGKSSGEVKDGMDCSFCAINTKTKTVEWSGAYNSLWYYQGGEIKEITADKQPIGKTDNPKPFTTHTLSLSGSTLYLFTDGYADQFGGPKGKKFKYQQLKDKLSVISSQPMEEQKKVLEETFNNWKGSLEQVDDILIIGIRV